MLSDPISDDESKAESSGLGYDNREEDQYIRHTGGDATWFRMAEILFSESAEADRLL